MSNLINEVARLKDLEGKATCGPWECHPSGVNVCGNEYPDCIACQEGGLFYDVCDDPDTHLLISLRNAAPNLLDAMGMIRAGDEAALYRIAAFLDTEAHCYFEYPSKTQALEDLAVLRRYRDIATKMEAESE